MTTSSAAANRLSGLSSAASLSVSSRTNTRRRSGRSWVGQSPTSSQINTLGYLWLPDQGVDIRLTVMSGLPYSTPCLCQTKTTHFWRISIHYKSIVNMYAYWGSLTITRHLTLTNNSDVINTCMTINLILNVIRAFFYFNSLLAIWRLAPVA